MMMQRYMQWFLLLALLAFASGCAQMQERMPGLELGETPEEKLATAYAVRKGVVKATTESLRAGRIDSGDAEKVLKLANQSGALLSTAKDALEQGSEDEALSNIHLAHSILQRIEAYLSEREAQQ